MAKRQIAGGPCHHEPPIRNRVSKAYQGVASEGRGGTSASCLSLAGSKQKGVTMIPNRKILAARPMYKVVAPILSPAELDALCVEHEMDKNCEVKARISQPSKRPCTIDAPCWCWGCPVCEVAYAEAPFLQQGAHDYLGSSDGRIDEWCAKTKREATERSSEQTSSSSTPQDDSTQQ